MTNYCPNCDHLLDLARSVTKVDKQETTEKTEAHYEKILKKISNDEVLTKDELLSIDVKELLNSNAYKEVQKKGKVRKILMDIIDDAQNSDDNIQAYLLCTNCQYSEPLPRGSLVYTKNPEGTTAWHDYENEQMYRNLVHQKTLPRTRNFVCPNGSCPSHKDVPTEACFFRKQNSFELTMVCVVCHAVKKCM